MRLTKLGLRQFRNITKMDIVPGEVLNFFVGDNAQGKTTLVESIFYLSTLKSFRPGKTQDLIQSGKEGFQLEGQLTQRGKFSPLTLKARSLDGQKKLFLNDKLVPSSKFVSQIRVVVFSPESLAAIKYGPELRRELIDQAVFQISTRAAQAQNDYIRALQQRNSCLKQMRMGILPISHGRSIIESLNPGFLRLASEITYYRLEFLDSIAAPMKEILSQIMGTQTSLRFAYESDHREWTEREYSAIHKRLENELRGVSENFTEEKLGLTLVGPHRHDLSFIFNETNSRIFCSQGQQRALILSFKIAEIVYHSKVFDSFPLLLLDDVLSEFDERKRRFLVDFLCSNEAQTFLTTTERTNILESGTVFQINAGQLVGKDVLRVNGHERRT